MSTSLQPRNSPGQILQWGAVPFARGSSQPESNPGLLHCRWILYQLSHQGRPSMANCNLGSGRVDLALVLTDQLLRVPWTAGRSNQSILKEISPGCSLEGLMLKLKLHYFGHLIRRVDSLEKTLMLGGIGGRRRRG